MPEWTFTNMIGWILMIIAFIILAGTLVGLKVGAPFWYLGCEGEIGGKNFTTLVDNKLTFVYENPRCDLINEDETSCKFTTFKNITRDNQSLPVCVWSDRPILMANGKNKSCFMNGEISCGDFTQLTIPICQNVPNCMPISAIKVAVERLNPR
jgi:hypothetical protein